MVQSSSKRPSGQTTKRPSEKCRSLNGFPRIRDTGMSEGQYLVGVDIGSSAIKLCQLKDVGGRGTLVKYGDYALPPQTIVDGHVMNQGVVVEGLRKIFSENKVRRRDVALSVSGHSVIIK